MMRVDGCVWVTVWKRHPHSEHHPRFENDIFAGDYVSHSLIHHFLSNIVVDRDDFPLELYFANRMLETAFEYGQNNKSDKFGGSREGQNYYLKKLIRVFRTPRTQLPLTRNFFINTGAFRESVKGLGNNGKLSAMPSSD